MLKLKSKDLLLAWIWYSYRAYPLKALHAMSQLFMAMLTGQSC
jgi:hypothetical protein